MDTAQPAMAAETDPIAAAAEAFKNYDKPAVERPRGPDGKFASAQPAEAEEEIEAEADDALEATEAEAESHDDELDAEAADEAQPEAIDLPTSWPAELAETWQSLPPEAQEFITKRDGEQLAAVNAKFQEAANVRKANEAVITEANANRQRFAEAADFVLSLVEPTPPPTSMLDERSPDYNPNAYHRQLAEFHQSRETVEQVKQQRENALAQLRSEAEAAEMQALAEIETRTRPNLLKDVPDLASPEKQGPVLQSLVQYAIAQGIPEYVFTDPEIARGVTSAQLHLTWKAQQYDKMVAAKAKVQPKAQKPAAPPVRAGVATSASAVKNAQYKKITDRLAREGSIEAGAALFKSLKF